MLLFSAPTSLKQCLAVQRRSRSRWVPVLAVAGFLFFFREVFSLRSIQESMDKMIAASAVASPGSYTIAKSGNNRSGEIHYDKNIARKNISTFPLPNSHPPGVSTEAPTRPLQENAKSSGAITKAIGTNLSFVDKGEHTTQTNNNSALPESDSESTNGSTARFDLPSVQTNHHANHSTYAYAFVVGGCDPAKSYYRIHLYGVLMAVFALRQHGSSSDMHLYIQMSHHSNSSRLMPEEARWFDAMNISMHYIPSYPDESFYKINMEKFRILSLTQYNRISFLDADVVPLVNLDYMMELSDRGILKENVIVPGDEEPGNGGYFILTPFPGAYEQVQNIIAKKDERISKLPPPKYWDHHLGWGHPIESPDYWMDKQFRKHHQWKFMGDIADQGLLYYWSKYVRQSVSIAFPGGLIENWGPCANGTGEIERQETLSGDMIVKDYPQAGSNCRAEKCLGIILDDYLHYFGERRKPYLVPPPPNLSSMVLPPAAGQTSAYWYWTLHQVSMKLNITLDLSNLARGQRPAFGHWLNAKQVEESLKASKLIGGG